MIEHGIIFLSELADKIRRGLKIQTRRLITPSTSLLNGTGEGIRKQWPRLAFSTAWVDPGPSPAGNPGPYLKVHESSNPDDPIHRVYPRVQVGDRFYVREDWAAVKSLDDVRASDLPRDSFIELKADVPLALAADEADRLRPGVGVLLAGGCLAPATKEKIEKYVEEHIEGSDMTSIRVEEGGKWRRAMHMPRWVSRTSLEVLEVRAQRVHDITEEDAAAEGFEPWDGNPDQPLTDGTRAGDAPYRAAFAIAWDEINGDRALWKSNPWAWVYTFREIERPR